MTIKQVSSISKLEDLDAFCFQSHSLCVISSIAKSPIGTVFPTSPTILTLPSEQAKSSAKNCLNRYKKSLVASQFVPLTAHLASTNSAMKKDITAQAMRKTLPVIFGTIPMKKAMAQQHVSSFHLS